MTLSLYPKTAPAPQAAKPVIALGAFSAAAWFVLFQIWAYARAGSFDYPLDDVYIHLSMASGIAKGYYGLNSGEAASAASSILYPFLLTPFAGTEFQRLLPLIWNFAATATSGALMGAACAYLPRLAARLTATLIPISLNMAGLGFTGMENTLHLTASLFSLFGLWIWLNDRQLRWWFVAALILGPMLRYEGLALSCISLLALALSGTSWRQLALLALAIFAPLFAFSAFLLSLDLPPLPNSVRVKAFEAHDTQTGLAGLLQNIRGNWNYFTGPILFFGSVAGLAAAYVARESRAPALLLAVVSGTLLAHMMVGRTGWMHRYETYIVLTFVAGSCITWASGRLKPQVSPAIGFGTIFILMGATALVTLPLYKIVYLNGPKAIAAQQGQMARFAQHHLKAPIGINDLGYVAWKTPYPILDIWGLADRNALDLRNSDTPFWASTLLERKGFDFAMVYDSWVGKDIAPHWVRLGKFTYLAGPSTLGHNIVSFYAADAEAAKRMRAAVLSWQTDLPASVTFTFEKGWQP